MIEAYSVSRLARYLKDLLESDLALSNLWLEGAVSNLSRSSAGPTYFPLKDGAPRPRRSLSRRPPGGAPLENGAQVLAHGNVSFYEARGDLQLVVDFVQPAGIGARQAELERLKEKLAARGRVAPARDGPLAHGGGLPRHL